MVDVRQLGPVSVRPGHTGHPAAAISYALGDLWIVTIERDLEMPAGGPTSLSIGPLDGEGEAGEWNLAGYDSDGIQQTDLRAVPLGDARKQLEAAWVEHRVSKLIAGLPEDFTGDYAFAKLAEIVCTLHGLNTRNPVGLIAKLADPKVHGTWATRVKRARERGFMTAGPEPTLTGKSLAMLRS